MLFLKPVKILRTLSGDLVTLPWWAMLFVLGLGYGLVLWSNHQFIYTEDVLVDHYQEFASGSMVNELIAYQKSREWIYYLLQQGLIISKITLVSVAIFTAAFFVKTEVSLILLFKIVIVAEYIPLSYEIFKLWHLLMTEKPGNFESLIQFAPWSLLDIVGPGSRQFWTSHLLGYFNVFEVVYVLFLALLYFACFEKSFSHCLKVVLGGYGSTLILWLTFISILLFHASVTD